MMLSVLAIRNTPGPRSSMARLSKKHGQRNIDNFFLIHVNRVSEVFPKTGLTYALMNNLGILLGLANIDLFKDNERFNETHAQNIT